MIKPVLQLDHVHVEFDGVVAVDGVDLSVLPGARHVILGPNGAGKSSLLAVVGGQIMPKRGRVLLEGRDITRLRPYQRARLGMGRTFQLSQVFPTMTVAENISAAIIAGSRRRSDPWRAANAKEVKEPLELTLAAWQLVPLAAKNAESLSYGQRRVLELAMATVTNPRLLILDEPTAGVEKSGVETIVDLITAIPSETSVLMIEHDMSVAFRLASDLTIMVGGRVVRSGPVTELRKDDDLLMAYLGEDRLASP